MTEIPLIRELAVIAVIGVLVAVVLARFKLPTVAGLLLAGALVGPGGFGLVQDAHAIEVLAEVGVVLLLFTIGLEFSLARLRVIAKQLAVGGSIQVGLTILVTFGMMVALDQPIARSIFYGFIFALSSTAIVLRALADRQELDAPHGRFIVGALIFQDLCVVPMVLLVPVLASGGNAWEAAVSIAAALGKAAAVVVATFVVARFVVPPIFRRIDRTRSREVFLLGVLAICVGTSWLTGSVGLSLALGAFLGGMVVAETEFGHRALGDMLPLRDAFTSIFFVSLGMLFDPRVLVQHPLAVAAMLGAMIIGKGFLATLAAVAMKFPARVAWLAGVGLAQFGEFGFVLLTMGVSAGLVGSSDAKTVIAAGVISMFLTPLLVRVAPHVSAGERLLRPLEKLLRVKSIDEAPEGDAPGREKHVIVVGYGVAGRILQEALARREIPHVVLELNADTVRQAHAKGAPVYYGDASSPEALEHAGIGHAAVVVALMNDAAALERVVAAARRIAPQTPVIVRTRYLAQRDGLLDLGAGEVIAEEVEAGVEMLARVLRRLGVARNLIEDDIHQARASTQPSERAPTLPRQRLADTEIAQDLKVDTVLIRATSPAVGKALGELDLRRRTRALVVAIRRGGNLIEELDPELRFEPDDLVFLAGRSQAIRAATELLDGTRASRTANESSP